MLVGIAMKMGHDKQTDKAAEHPNTPSELRGRGEGNRATTWRELGLPSTLPRISAVPRLPSAISRDAAKQQIYDALEKAGGRRITITRGDGKQDAIFGRVAAPNGQGDVMLTDRFVNHLIDDHPGQTREEYANFILPSLNNPAEVWMQSHRVHDRIVHRRAFITAFEGSNTVAIVQEDRLGSLAWTFFRARRRGIDRMRRGYLLYRCE